MYSNGKITAPVSIYDVQRALGVGSNDLKTLCDSETLNLWAKYKPVRLVSQNDSPAPITDSTRRQNSYGVHVGANYDFAPTTDMYEIEQACQQFGITTMAQLEAAISQGFLKRSGPTANYFCRLTDFVHTNDGGTTHSDGKGYNHNAAPTTITAQKNGASLAFSPSGAVIPVADRTKYIDGTEEIKFDIPDDGKFLYAFANSTEVRSSGATYSVSRADEESLSFFDIVNGYAGFDGSRDTLIKLSGGKYIPNANREIHFYKVTEQSNKLAFAFIGGQHRWTVGSSGYKRPGSNAYTDQYDGTVETATANTNDRRYATRFNCVITKSGSTFTFVFSANQTSGLVTTAPTMGNIGNLASWWFNGGSNSSGLALTTTYNGSTRTPPMKNDFYLDTVNANVAVANITAVLYGLSRSTDYSHVYLTYKEMPNANFVFESSPSYNTFDIDRGMLTGKILVVESYREIGTSGNAALIPSLMYWINITRPTSTDVPDIANTIIFSLVYATASSGVQLHIKWKGSGSGNNVLKGLLASNYTTLNAKFGHATTSIVANSSVVASLEWYGGSSVGEDGYYESYTLLDIAEEDAQGSGLKPDLTATVSATKKNSSTSVTRQIDVIYE